MKQNPFNQILSIANALPECESFHLHQKEWKDVNKYSIRVGVIVPETACSIAALEYYKDLSLRNINSTFYKEWEEVTSKTRDELFLDQIRHYASTYGTDFQGEAWKPERIGDLPEFPYSELKVANSISLEGLHKKWLSVITSGIAMSKELIDTVTDIMGEFDWDLPKMSDIKNRELRYVLRHNYNIKDYIDSQDALMQVLHDTLGITMLVKSKDEMKTLHLMPSTISILNTKLKDKDLLKLLSEGYLRNKNLWLTLKQETSDKEFHHAVNRLRKLAVKNHKPMEKSYWLRLDELSEDQRHDLFMHEGIFHLVQVYNAISNRNATRKVYQIRNGKVFIKEWNIDEEFRMSEKDSIEITDQIYDEIHNRLVTKWNGKVVRLPKGISLAVPTSEKNFIGSIPMNSYIDLTSNSDSSYIIGIYWRNEWGAHDLDLHSTDISGSHIGWNGDYCRSGEKVIFSGDMTDADPEATELDLFKGGLQDSIFSVNCYNGRNNSEFDLVLARYDGTRFHMNYIIDPRMIDHRIHMKFPNNSRNMSLGFLFDSKFYFRNSDLGTGIVPDKWSIPLIYAVKSQADTSLKIDNILDDDDDESVKVTYDPTAEVDFDFNSKSDIIKFFNCEG